MISELFSQVMIFIIPILLFQVFWIDKTESFKLKTHKAKPVFEAFCCIAIMFCMTFPIHILPGYIFDLRIIPVLIAFFYGGFSSSLIASIVLVLYRWYLGGEGFYSSAITMILMLMIFFFFKNKIWNKSNKILLSVIVLFLNSFITIMILVIKMPSHYLNMNTYLFLITYFVIQVLAVWSVILLIDNLQENVRLNVEKKHREEMLKSIGEMSATVAHEVRNPLMVVRGFIQLMSEEPYIPDKKKSYLRVAMGELDRAQEIINDYLDLAKSQKLSIEKIDVKKLIEDIIGIISPYALMKGIAIHEDLEASIVFVGDKGKLTQILMNLIKNAIEATPMGGLLRICLQRRDTDFIIEIIDNGKGMSDEEIHKIGTPFFTTKENGTGLGLNVCYKMTALMRGSLTVKSELGKGTQFTLSLPLE